MKFRQYTKGAAFFDLKRCPPSPRCPLPSSASLSSSINSINQFAKLCSYRSTSTGSIVIREKKISDAYSVSSLVDTRSVLTGDLQLKKEQGYTEGTVILVRETLKPLKNRKDVVMWS